jgi:hypothetical protein
MFLSTSMSPCPCLSPHPCPFTSMFRFHVHFSWTCKWTLTWSWTCTRTRPCTRTSTFKDLKINKMFNLITDITSRSPLSPVRPQRFWYKAQADILNHRYWSECLTVIRTRVFIETKYFAKTKYFTKTKFRWNEMAEKNGETKWRNEMTKKQRLIGGNQMAKRCTVLRRNFAKIADRNYFRGLSGEMYRGSKVVFWYFMGFSLTFDWLASLVAFFSWGPIRFDLDCRNPPPTNLGYFPCQVTGALYVCKCSSCASE